MQADFTYGSAPEREGGLLSLTVFADDAASRSAIVSDLANSGLRVEHEAALEPLAGDGAPVTPCGDVVVAECLTTSAVAMAALAVLDDSAAKARTPVVMLTTLDALDDVFACMDSSDPQILVDPGQAEKSVAMGRALANLSGVRVRELSQEDRVAMLRLTEEVGNIARRLDDLTAGSGQSAVGGAFRFHSPADRFRGEGGDATDGTRTDDTADGNERSLLRKPRPPLPDPRLVREIIRQREARGKFFDAALFADPAWDMMLDLTAARAEHARVSITSLCIASGVPPTTALRWIATLTEAGLLERVEDPGDKRRAFMQLSDKAVDAMARYFVETGVTADR
ncbi:hypothetical protein HME9302_01799 [Alteripontixanthobacter maritimus]|uniref:HTH marR-type domain-containing protein n=1 Tax=Alteripontixanthobacter maritimus TaxID=2161824 RepID=A0A369QBK5_9SPHN|nr:winged helix DNA-binding protein [Alteripontixanthobacter maritimus]RDC60587.1 hypothetical protein HME9302_01799 [Alteripontixanthobacter maritimus]